MERARFLDRVRHGLSDVDGPPLPADLPVTPASDDGRPPAQRFMEELRAVGGMVDRISPADLAGSVAAAAQAAEARTAVIGPDLGPFADVVAAGGRPGRGGPLAA